MLRGTLICLSAVVLVTAQNSLSSVLSSNGLSSFQTYLNQFPTLLSQLNNGNNLTILAPSNAAVDTFLKSGDATIGNYSENLQALLQYHVIKGHYPRASLKQTPLFLQTLASNGTSYANVTGGQRIVVTSSGQNITFQSGFKRKSTLKTGDFFFSSGSVGGVVHVIDRLLSLPEDGIETAHRTGLSNLLGILAAFPTNAQAIGIPDETIFAPNSTTRDLANYTTEQMNAIQGYHLVPGVVYSPDLTDGKALVTSLGPGKALTITVQDGDTYVNDAKILATDYLISWGVIHVIDRPLNPNSADARPPTPGWRTHLPTGAYIGIGVAAALVAIGVVPFVCCFIKRRKRQQESDLVYTFEEYHNELANDEREMAEMANNERQIAELGVGQRSSNKLSNSAAYYELDHVESAREPIYELG